MMIFTSILFSCFFCFSAGTGSKWTYDDPSKWKTDFPNCGGEKQSPINIMKSATTCNEFLAGSLIFANFNTTGSGNFTIANNGHTCTVDTSSAQATTTLNGGDTFKLAQFHFHWGSNDSQGSEHQVNNKSFPAELHLVHYNSKYSTFSEAKNKSDGLAVIGVFIIIGKENTAFNNFLNLNVSTDGSKVDFKAFAVNDVLPEDKSAFYRYSGSLTTPTCDQTVTWTVLANQIQMSRNQLDKFRKLKTNHGKPLVNNFRPVQPLNNRQILSSFDKGCNPASSFKASIFIVLFFIFVRFGNF